MDGAAALLVACCAVSLALYALAWLLVAGWTIWRRIVAPRRAAAALAGGPRTGVTILKPLCGADDDLERNLVSFLRLEHEPLQFVFGAADPGDPALELVRRLARRHPHRDVAIVTGCNEEAASPKVGVMERLLPHARHDVLLLSDSDVRVSPDEVARVLPSFDDARTGMVYQPVVGIGERTLPAAFENLHYTELAGFLTVAVRLLAGQHVVNAKGQWVRRGALEDAGGFAAVRHDGADDYALSRLVAAAGWRLRLAAAPVCTVHRDWSWRSLARRHLRHAAMRRRLCPWSYPLELFVNPLPWTLALLATDAAAWVPALVALKMALEVSAARMLRGAPLHWRHAVAIPLKDLCYTVGWFAALAVRTVHWRGRTYAIGPRARLLPVSAGHLPESRAAGAAA